MANLNGFVKLHRKMIEWGWYSDCVVKDVFLHILMTANFKSTSYMGYELHPGDAIIGYSKLSTELGFSVQQVRTALKKLESTGEITKKSTNKFTIVTVENWAFYQGDDEIATNEQQTNNKPSTNHQQTSNKRATNEQQHLKNDKNDKNDKKDKKDKNIYGELQNVKLTPEEYVKLMNRFPDDYEDRINKLSFYIASKGDKYKSHYATILNWAKKEADSKPKKSRYDFIDDIDINEYGGE